MKYIPILAVLCLFLATGSFAAPPTAAEARAQKRAEIEVRLKNLNEARRILKIEFIGIDPQIDQILDSIQNWYLLPESMRTPIIVNLWGMTGVGKTSLVQRLIELLNLAHQYVETDMRELTGKESNGKASGSYARNYITTNMELDGKPSVWLFDEMQRARTIDQSGSEIDRPLLSPLWSLMSSGIVPIDNFRKSVENTLDLVVNRHGFLDAGQILTLKKAFKLPDTPAEIFEKFQRDPKGFCASLHLRLNEVPIQRRMDFRRSVVFVSGNLDDAYQGVGLMDDDMASADDIHKMSLKVNLTTILDSLKLLFRNEEIARLGSNHVIYPAWSAASYRGLIAKHLALFNDEFVESLGTRIEFDKSVSEFLYNEGVIPAQGSRPLLSIISQLITAHGPAWQLLALQQKKDPEVIKVKIEGDEMHVDGYLKGKVLFSSVKNVANVRKKIDQETHPEPFLTRVARHEAGHAVVGMILYGELPAALKSTSRQRGTGGFVRFKRPNDSPLSRMMQDLAVQLAGKAAEELYFGEAEVSGGARSDLTMATELSASIVAKYGLGSHIGQSNPSMSAPMNMTTFKAEDDKEAEKILKKQYAEAAFTLLKYRKLWDALSDYMKLNKSVSRTALIQILMENFTGPKAVLDRILREDCEQIFISEDGDIAKLP